MKWSRQLKEIWFSETFNVEYSLQQRVLRKFEYSLQLIKKSSIIFSSSSNLIFFFMKVTLLVEFLKKNMGKLAFWQSGKNILVSLLQDYQYWKNNSNIIIAKRVLELQDTSNTWWCVNQYQNVQINETMSHLTWNTTLSSIGSIYNIFKKPVVTIRFWNVCNFQTVLNRTASRHFYYVLQKLK